jgi:hypothetical protein
MVEGVPYVHGWACTAAFGIGTCLASPALRTFVENGVRSRYPQPSLDSRIDMNEFRRKAVSAMMHEKVKIELTPLEVAETFGATIVARHKLSTLILPRLDPACEEPDLRRVAPSKAAEVLREQALTCDEVNYRDWLHLRRTSDAEIERRVSDLIDRVVLAVPAYELRYWDGRSAAIALRKVLST